MISGVNPDKEMTMKTKIIHTLTVLVVAAVITAGCVVVIPGVTVEGSGNIITQDREVREFTEVRLQVSGNVILRQGPMQSLQVKTDDNIMPLIETEVRGKKLTISHGKHHLRPTVFEVYITVKNLEGAAISGSGDISGEGRFVTETFYAKISGSGDIDFEVETDNLSSDISGSGSIRLSGKARDYAASISGSGTINAFDVTAENASVKISGSGDCKITALETLHTKISGSGDVYYRGRPQIHVKISGSGSLESQN
jgi:hypothetical protein